MTGDVALVTGAGQGIGAAISRRLAKDGYHVCVNDVVPDRAAEVAAEIRSQGWSAAATPADISDADSVDRMFDRVEAEFGMVKALVNNAGIAGNAAIRNVSNETWNRVMSVDVTGVFYCTRRALSSMRDAREGAVVTISSRAWLGWWGQSSYATAKAGVIGLTRALAIEMSSRNVRLNVVAPGLIDTEMLRDRDEEALQRLIKSVPIGSLGTPQDIAAAVSFLVSGRARTITGQVLYVCGGKSVYAYPDWPDDG